MKLFVQTKRLHTRQQISALEMLDELNGLSKVKTIQIF